MADGDKIKVVGYAQRVFYDNGIEYRNFSDALVGNQFTDDGGATVFTSANFRITASLNNKTSKLFLTKKYSPFMTLEDMKIDPVKLTLLTDNNNAVKLNLDKSDLCNYAYFGSLTEFIRVSLENIIINWPASLYITSIDQTISTTGFTAEDYVYDSLTDTSTFKVGTGRLTNKFDINHKTSGSIINTFNETNDLRNLTVNYFEYVISNSIGDFNIIDFTGNTEDVGDYLWFTVNGDAFSGQTASTENYHIKPNEENVEIFFNTLPDFESNLLNRLTLPKYKSKYNFNVESDNGSILLTEREVIWPVSDGYNIDFDTLDYVDFATQLLNIGESSDKTKTNLMVRFLTTDSISDFDTLPTCEGDEIETAGQKMNSTLKVYGREYDEIKKYISGIKFANTVTYDKKNNTPDIYLKNLARVMGWELVSSVLENDLLTTYLSPADSSFSGHSRGLTPAEAEIELWRRIILNTPWIWKSKGTRKVIEFFFNFIGTPNGLVAFNEYIYKAKEPIDMDLFRDILVELFGTSSIDGLNVDSEGYPRVLPNNANMYFQKAGLWYRETAGENSNIDILEGNNPHVGPYDGGQEYIDQFSCLIPNFSAVTVHNQTISTSAVNIFTNYNSGLVNNALEHEVYADVVNLDNIPLSACYELVTNFIEDPKPTTERTDCGCETGEGDDAIQIYVKKVDNLTSSTPTPIDCGYTGFTLDEGGFIQFNLPNGKVTLLSSQECCEALGFTYQSGDISCRWSDSITLDNRACNGFEPATILMDGKVTWSNPVLQIGATEVSAECCRAYGYLAVMTAQGTYECYFDDGSGCLDWVQYQIATDGLITWINNAGELTTEISPECCLAQGHGEVSLPLGKAAYGCYVPTAPDFPDGGGETGGSTTGSVGLSTKVR